jgi:hypothetical protein
LLLTSAISFAFFGVGQLVWWYARQRQVAVLFLLVCTCLAFSLLLAVPSEVMNDALIQALGSVSASLGLFLLLLLVLYFPHQVLRSWHRSGWRLRLFWLWLIGVGILNVLSACYCLTGTRFPPAAWFEAWYMLSYVGTTLSIVGVLLAETRMRLSRRERQQLRLLFTGLGLGFAPWLCLSVLPDLLHALLPSFPFLPVEDDWTMPGLLLLPLTLGYTVLRYQFLVFDALVARVVCGLFRVIGLVICAYLGLAGLLLLPQTLPILIGGALLSTGLSIGWWVLAQRLTMRLLFAEMDRDRHLITSAFDTLAQTSDLPAVARTVQSLVAITCGSQGTLLLVRDETSGLYSLIGERPAENAHLRVALDQLIEQHYPAPPREEFALAPQLQRRLLQSRRPSFLRELISREEKTINDEHIGQMLLIALPEDGLLRALVVLDGRDDQQLYAGADFEAMRELSRRVIPILSSALHQAQKRAQTQILEEGLRQTTQLSQLGPEDLTVRLAELMTRFVPAQVEIWEQREHVWYRLALAGAHMHAWSTEQTRRFLAHTTQRQMPLFEPEGLIGHPLPLVMLPLEHDASHLSRFLAHYSRPSFLLPERRHLLALAGLHARRMLQEARTRLPDEREYLSLSCVPALRAFEQAAHMASHHATRDALQRLVECWRGIQQLESRWLPPSFLRRPSCPAPSSRGVVLLVVSHPLLAKMLARACEWYGYTVILRPTLRESLRWLEQASSALTAILVDEAALSLELEVFVQVVKEYVAKWPRVAVCSARPSSVQKRSSLQVAVLPKPFTLAQLFHTLSGQQEE